jgi:hypothetical protein
MLARRVFVGGGGDGDPRPGGALGYRLFERQLMKAAMVPTAEFREVPMPQGPTYADAALWISGPTSRTTRLWLPRVRGPGDAEPARLRSSSSTPTSFLDRSSWNAPIDHVESQLRARLFVRHQASVFNGIGEIWAPKYRQATFGAFLTTKEEAEKALDFAYRDVARRVRRIPDAGSQGPADHPGRPQPREPSSNAAAIASGWRERRRKRISRLMSWGWPISTTADLELLGLPACETSGPAGLHPSWQTFGTRGPKMVTDVLRCSEAPTGSRARDRRCCASNPLTGNKGDEAPPKPISASIIPNATHTEGELRALWRPGAVRRFNGLPADRRGRAEASALRASGQELPRLRLCALLGEHPRGRRGAAEELPRQMITAKASDFARRCRWAGG